ncbi:hypothetical protein D0U04_11785 [Bacillus clarus]|uniref:Uncharacterized protein n=1 Tax=Bacillus clarus TaxID=2338372 RepID=A0ABX9KW78_9BACI|nr:hypothetical protein D0U04_11785 [Bacillus clarus]
MEVARSECEGDGTSDVEALFASEEEVKPPNILAAGTGLYKKWRWLVQNKRKLETLTKRRFLPHRKGRNGRLF